MALRAAFIALLAVTTAGLAPLRASPDAPEPTVRLSVVVTGGRGQPVRALIPADLEITEDGQKKRVASVAPRDAAPRTIGLLLDDYHVSPGANSLRARDAVLAFLEQHVRPSDSVFVMKPLDPHPAISPSSVEAVRQRVLEFTGRKGNFTPATAFEAEYMSATPPAAQRQRAQVVRAALEALTMAMRDPIDAPKALVLVTEGFSTDDRSRTRTTTMLAIARTAALSHIPVYVVDPAASHQDQSPFNDSWRAVTSQTGGALFTGGADTQQSLSRVAADLAAQYVVSFESSGKQDGAFHGVQVRLTRPGVSIRAASGYWAPFAPLPAVAPRVNYAALLTPHVTGLIHPWFRMSPGVDGKTRVTFLWASRRTGGERTPASVRFAAITFEGNRLHDAPVAPAALISGDDTTRTSFEAPPGPLQVSMAVTDAAGRVLDTEVRYIDVPALESTKPVIAAVEFIRPRSLPEFTAMKADPGALPTDVRDFMRQDRLLIRVRAYARSAAAKVSVRLLNRPGQVLLELPQLDPIDGAAQFELPFARYPRGEYRLEIRASAGEESLAQLVTIRVIG